MSFVETSILKNATIMLLHSERDEIKLDPEYQRSGGVWTIAKRRLLVDSILNDYDIPKLYFHDLGPSEISESGFRYSVIDGRQRLEAIWDFLDGKFALADDFEYQRDPSIDMGGFTYQDIAQEYPKIRIKFDSFVLPIVLVTTADGDLDLIEDMFSRLNEAVPLNAAEKRNSIGGRFVAAINKISNHQYFDSKVKFTDSRYRHREVSARLLLLEDSLQNSKGLVDTKREYLDGIARRYKAGASDKVYRLEEGVSDVLDDMCSVFAFKDELLSAQGIQGVYFLLFRGAKKSGELSKISRADLLRFRDSLISNREIAASDFEGASFELLEFDRLNQQGTNDASSIKERYAILCNALGVSVDPAVVGSREQAES